MRSVLTDIQPKVDRWRSGLDALLVFVRDSLYISVLDLLIVVQLGLFSAIVTAFLVESLNRLEQSDSARTNELLANLTDIIITLSNTNPAALNLQPPLAFAPDPSDIRLNAFWSLSLILSVRMAILLVRLRGLCVY